MQKLGLLISSTKRGKGFTLMELLIVIAIIAVLVTVTIPVFSTHLEKTRNTVDVYNAKVIASSVRTYLLSNPDKLSEFIDTYGANPGAYRPYILVTDEVLVASSDSTGILKAALSESGLLGKEIREERFNGVLCKTRSKWQAYTIGFNVLDGELLIGFCGMTDKNAIARRWTVWSGTDPTTFRSMCTSVTS